MYANPIFTVLCWLHGADRATFLRAGSLGCVGCSLAPIAWPNQNWLICCDCNGCCYIFNSLSYQNITSRFLCIFPSIDSHIYILISKYTAFPKPTLKEYNCYKIMLSKTLKYDKLVWGDWRGCPFVHSRQKQSLCMPAEPLSLSWWTFLELFNTD